MNAGGSSVINCPMKEASMKHTAFRPLRMNMHVMFIFIIDLLVFSIILPYQAMAGPALDCAGSAEAYRLQGIPCDCINGQIVCNQSTSGRSSKSGLSSENQMKLEVMDSVTDAVAGAFIKWINGPTPAERAKSALRQQQLQRAQKEREMMLEFERQKLFAEKKQQILDNLKGVSTGTLELKTDFDDAAQGPKYVDPTAAKEQDEFDHMNAEWMKKQKQLIEERLQNPNKFASAVYDSLKTNAPPLPWEKINELHPGDVLLFQGGAISYADNKISGGNAVSRAAHTVIYLKDVNGTKLFLDNQPNEGPRIISGEEFLSLYGHRGSDVARLAQPLNEKEGKALFSAAVEMAQKNNKHLVNKDTWFGKYLSTDTNYGAWGENNIVCSEADWALINAAGRTIPHSDNILKLSLGFKFTPSDFYNSPYFLVTRFQ